MLQIYHLKFPFFRASKGHFTCKISYIYDTAGVKQQKTANGVLTDYLDGYQYENGKLQFFPHAEGYVTVENGQYEYVYNYTDHLGNIRLSFTDANGNGAIDKTEIIEENNYYLFGLKHKGYNNIVSAHGNAAARKYKYNSKELQDEFDLGWYDYGARMYDADLGKWFVIDPLAEPEPAWTPFRYGFDNPIRYWDVDGRFEMDPEQYKKYERLAHYLANDIQAITGNRRIMNALKKYGQFTDKQIKSDLRWGHGPKINVVQLGKSKDGVNNRLGLYFPQKYGKNTLALDVDMVERLENTTGDELDIILFQVAKTLLHEYTHFGDAQDGVQQKDASDALIEEGNEFEKSAYGRDIQGYNDIVDVLNEYNKRNRIDKRYEHKTQTIELEEIIIYPKKEDEDN